MNGRLSQLVGALPLVLALGAGCGGSVAEIVEPGDPAYELTGALVMGGVLTVQGLTVNPWQHGITYEILAPCSLTLRAYPPGAQGGAPAWDQLNWLNRQPGGCKRIPVPMTLAAGATRPFTASADVSDILGDSLPEGPYFPAAVIWRWSPTGGPLELMAEQVSLRP